MKMQIRSRRGSFSVFISIMISSMIFLMSILLHVTVISGKKMMVQSALIQQQDLLLSHYSEILEDRYGLFAATLSSNHEEVFYAMTGNPAEMKNFRAYGIDELSGAVLYYNILHYSKPRFPVQAATQLLDRINIFTAGSRLSSNTIPEAGSAGPDSDNKAGGTCLGFNDIISMLLKLKPDQPGSNNANIPENINQPFDNINNLLTSYDTEEIFENDISRTIKSDLTISEKALDKISDFVEKFYSVESSDFYNRLTFEFYLSEMFSCKVNFQSKNNEKIYRKDMRGRSFEIVSPSSEPEIEKIIFGFEENDKNEFFSRISIQGVRFVSNLIANMTDSKKRAEIKSLAATVIALIVIASEGTIIISTETAEAVVAVIQSTAQAVSDCNKLMDGGYVELLPIEGAISVETCYLDYLKFMLFSVPKNVKLARIESIIKKNTAGINTIFYTGIGVSCRYRGGNYFYENSYFGSTD